MPFLNQSMRVRRAYLDSLQRWRPGVPSVIDSTAATLSGLTSTIAPYVIGLLSASLNDGATLSGAINALNVTTAQADGEAIAPVLEGLSRALEARADLMHGRPDDAMSLLHQLPPAVPIYKLFPFSLFGAERLMVAVDDAERTGNDASTEALRALTEGNFYDVVWSVPSHLALGNVYARRDMRAAATAEYSIVLRLLRTADPELVPIRHAAEDGMRRLSPH
jgi:hypothetical protein